MAVKGQLRDLPRTVDALMDLLYTGRGSYRGVDPVDLHDHALQTAALLRRSHPSDKELQLAGLVHDIGPLLDPDAGDPSTHADRAADAVRPLLGERVAQLVRHYATVAGSDPYAYAPGPYTEDAITLRQADEAGKAVGVDAGVMEDWRSVMELVAARV